MSFAIALCDNDFWRRPVAHRTNQPTSSRRELAVAVGVLARAEPLVAWSGGLDCTAVAIVRPELIIACGAAGGYEVCASDARADEWGPF